MKTYCVQQCTALAVVWDEWCGDCNWFAAFQSIREWETVSVTIIIVISGQRHLRRGELIWHTGCLGFIPWIHPVQRSKAFFKGGTKVRTWVVKPSRSQVNTPARWRWSALQLASCRLADFDRAVGQRNIQEQRSVSRSLASKQEQLECEGKSWISEKATVCESGLSRNRTNKKCQPRMCECEG